VALTSCCRGLWTRSDVTDSPVLWGAIAASRRQAARPDLSVSLAAWLARHKAAVRSVQLSCSTGSPAVVLAGLAGGAISNLEIHHTQGVGLELAEALAPIVHLGSSLTTLQLSCCRLGRMPPQLSALSALQSLSLPGNTGLAAAGEAGFSPLSAATQLTALRLTGCALRRLPSQLTALAPSLQVLGLANNTNLGHWVAGATDTSIDLHQPVQTAKNCIYVKILFELHLSGAHISSRMSM